MHLTPFLELVHGPLDGLKIELFYDLTRWPLWAVRCEPDPDELADYHAQLGVLGSHVDGDLADLGAVHLTAQLALNPAFHPVCSATPPSGSIGAYVLTADLLHPRLCWRPMAVPAE